MHLMNKPAAVGLLVLIALGAFIAGRVSSGSGPHPQSTSTRILYYVDPMHPAYKSDKPGNAPDCGMALAPVYAGDDEAQKLKLGPGAVAISPDKQRLICGRVEPVEKNSGSRAVR